MYPYITFLNQDISTYGLCMLLGVLLVFFLGFNRARRCGVSLEDMLIVFGCSLLGGLVGAGLLYALVTYPILTVIKAIFTANFEIFGGAVYYGGLIGGVLGALIGLRVAKVSPPTLERSVLPFLPIGHAVGRVGCIMAGCCNGMEYNGPMAVYYPHSVAGLPPDTGYFPVQILEAVCNLVIAAVLLALSKKEKPKYMLLFFYLFAYAVMRFLVEFLRGDEIRGMYFGLSTAQWISILLVVAGAMYFCLLLFKTRSKESKPTQ